MGTLRRIFGTNSGLAAVTAIALLVLSHGVIDASAAQHASKDAPTPRSQAATTPPPADNGSQDPAQPTVLAFDPPAVEFGPMFVGKTRHASVKVTNASDAPVTVSRTIPGCPCTKASDPPKEPLAPGASFTIDVSLDGGDYGGAKLKKVVNFLIEGRPTEFLWLHGDVQKVIEVNPQVVDARKAADGDALKVSLQSARFLDFTVLGVEPAGIVAYGKDPSTEHELVIDVAALRARGMPTKLTVTTDHPDADVIFVLIRAPPPPAPPAPPDAPAPPRV